MCAPDQRLQHGRTTIYSNPGFYRRPRSISSLSRSRWSCLLLYRSSSQSQPRPAPPSSTHHSHLSSPRSSSQASALTKSCNCNSSVATRVGFSLIFLLNSLLAWLMLSDWAMRSLAKWSYEYIKMSCTDGKCYGVLAVSWPRAGGGTSLCEWRGPGLIQV